MSLTSLDDDDLFGEAATEMEDDVEAAIADAREALPAPEAVWETEAGNVLGVLNGLKSGLDPGNARERLREAKKWYAVGSRADAFEDPGALEAEIKAVESTVADLETAAEQVGELTATIPALRKALEDEPDTPETAQPEPAQSGL